MRPAFFPKTGDGSRRPLPYNKIITAISPYNSKLDSILRGKIMKRLLILLSCLLLLVCTIVAKVKEPKLVIEVNVAVGNDIVFYQRPCISARL